MVATNFLDSKIPQNVSMAMAKNNSSLASQHVEKVLRVLMTGASNMLGEMKSLDTPKAIAFRKPDGSFIAGAKVEYNKNPDDPDNPASGNWSYIWTFKEQDLNGAVITDVNTNILTFDYFRRAADKLFRMKFSDDGVGIMMFNLILDGISQWLDENAVDGDERSLVSTGVMEAACAVENGVVTKSLTPQGEIKELIKGDDTYQNPV